MIRSPLGLRLDPDGPIREQIREAARLGAKGLVIDALGDLRPDRLSDTGRREFRHLLRSVELSLIALSLPTRRAFDTTDQLDDRLKRAEGAFTLAYELGAKLVLARVGAVPDESEALRHEAWFSALRELGNRADRHGVRFAVETGAEPGNVLRTALDRLDVIGLAASLDPASLLQNGNDPVAATRELGPWVVHAYATDANNSGSSSQSANFRRTGSTPGTVDWEEYIGALEEINYRGYLTIWPDPSRDPGSHFSAIVQQLSRL